MDPDIKDKICKHLNLSPDHEQVKQTELVFHQVEYENSLEEQLDMIRKLEQITNKALRLHIQVVSTR